MSATGIIPILHQVINLGPFHDRITIQAYSIFWMCVIYSAGLLTLVSKIPERFSKSGRFDHWGNSHQIWHVLVAVAVYAHYDGYHRILQEVEQYVC